LQTNATDGMAADLTPGDASSISIRYRRGPGEEGFGFKLENDTVKMLIPDGGAGVWQELTDPLSVKITKFSIDTKRAGGRERSDNLEPHIIPCPYLCPDGTTDCWPRARPQEYTLSIEGESLRDGTVRRSLSTSVATRSLTTSFEVFPGQQGQNNQACPTLPN
jgi:type IV pilus assembly protein PilW